MFISGRIEEIDWDALYGRDEDETDVDMKSHGSVITHLLSQVCIYLIFMLHWTPFIQGILGFSIVIRTLFLVIFCFINPVLISFSSWIFQVY